MRRTLSGRAALNDRQAQALPNGHRRPLTGSATDRESP
jgi:hypothetical protein